MNLEKELPLTETTYYILLALRKPGHGYAVMQRAEELSDGRVRIAAGTMYGAIDHLSRCKWIEAVPSEDPRRKVYQTTKEGFAVLQLEAQRLEHMLTIYHQMQEEQ
ncbi:MAG: PadR family transcriptional regulator [Faecalibacterium sp.]|jgi:DNA-binding PadR family transcriptional regulator|nr:PadR family transcriptional regulator [Faecalibacterium sp.]